MYDPEILIQLAAEFEREIEPYLKWSTIYDRYERGKNSKVAELTMKYTDGSYASREAQALASEEFRKYLDEWHEADKKRVSHKVKVDTLKTKIESFQSFFAHERERMRHLGGA